MTGKADEWVKVALALAGAFVVLATAVSAWWLTRRATDRARAQTQTVRRVSTLVLWGLALFGVGNYFGWDSENLTKRNRFDGYDLVHYYLNAKYFHELGYTGLYEAMVIADSERKDNYRRWGFRAIRDLRTDERVSLDSVRRRADEIKGRFTKARWREFRHDFRFIQRTVSRRLQIELLNDHGYNGPPFLQTIAGAITNRVRVEHLKLLCTSEALLVLVMFVVIYRTFGSRITALSVLWFMVTFSARWPGLTFGVFRLDWCVALVLACCLLVGADEPERVETSRWVRLKPWLAGILIAYATMQRIFPLLWLFGLGVRALWRLFQKRQIDPVFARVFAGFVVASALFGGVAWHVVGERNVNEWVRDIRDHLKPENLSQQRMGFGIAVAYRGEWGRFDPPSARLEKFAYVGELKRWRYAGAVFFLVILALTLRPDPGGSERNPRSRAEDVTMLGFIPFYFLMIASHYYWVNRLTMVLHHGRHEERQGEHAVFLAILLLLEVLSNYIDETTHFRYALTATASVGLGFYAAAIIGMRLVRMLRPQPAPLQALESTPTA